MSSRIFSPNTNVRGIVRFAFANDNYKVILIAPWKKRMLITWRAVRDFSKLHNFRRAPFVER